jgi:hypothetical protein
MNRPPYYNKEFSISRGDTVNIYAQGVSREGEVLSAYWDELVGWYIELQSPNGYCYYKQFYDGGTVTMM